MRVQRAGADRPATPKDDHGFSCFSARAELGTMQASRFPGSPMLITRTLLGVTLLLAGAGSAAQDFRSGWLSDNKDAVDRETGAKVSVVANMFQSQDHTGKSIWIVRYVGVEIPRGGLKADRVRVYDRSGKLIVHSFPEAHEVTLAPGSDKKGTLLKLFLERQAGFEFRVEVGS
jgi:hypothetical protein